MLHTKIIMALFPLISSKRMKFLNLRNTISIFIVSTLALLPEVVQAQSDSVRTAAPSISYARPIQKYIAELRVVGNKSYDADIVRNISGLRIGQAVELPGEEITHAIRSYLRNGLFSEVSIEADKVVGDSVWLSIRVQERPRLSKVNINGVKKSEAKNLLEGSLVALQQGTHVTPNIIDRSEIMIKRFFDDKGFSNAAVTSRTIPDPTKEGYVILDFDVNKSNKTHVANINFVGNNALSDYKLRRAMKKTNERFSFSKHFRNSILEIFSTKKFVEKEYKADLSNIISLYHEHGYRDAEILKDTVMVHDDKHVDIEIHLFEGKQYFIKDINFVGNTIYATDDLERIVGIKAGDVYDQKKLNDRLSVKEDALNNLYSNNGYLFAYSQPIETEVKGDSVSLDIRIHEGKPATISNVAIRGNDQLYEEVVRRELYTKPGMLFNREYVMRSMRQIAQMGHFDQEKIIPNIMPNETNGTVDIEWQLTPKSNDQIELSLGWSATGLIGMAGVKFSNFSLRNLFDRESYKGVIPLPRGDGQTLAIRAQTNARYYQSYSIQFMDPWFGRKRPNVFSFSLSYTRQTDINREYYNSQIKNFSRYNPYGLGGYGYPSVYPNSYGSHLYGYGNGYGNGYYGAEMNSIYESAFDPDKTMDIFGANIMYGKRLTWPDDNFQISLGLTYNMYRLHNWSSYFYNFGMQNGVANDINLNMTLTRSSTDNPIYTRRGSEFTINASSTLPYSLWDGIDYSDLKLSEGLRNKFIEYYKVKSKGQVFVPLMDPNTTKHTPVLMGSIEGGVIGSFNPHKRSPFGTYYMGGDGMSSYYGGYLNEMVGLRGYKNGSISGASGQGAYTYAKVFMELRYPVIFENSTTIWLLGFAEAGNAWSRVADFNPFQLKRSAGLGVRIMLPMVGLMGIDWGYGFDAPDGSSTKGGSNIHFVLGQQF